ncbi:MAG: BMP family ABC transporter substrate-binding protein [Oscillospiraceae bacterium]|nr:BMP family ABC transporter substrate-binding protein [Oscillospiraceae bacterium]
MNIQTSLRGALACFLAAALLTACAGAPETAKPRREVKVTVLVDNLGDHSYNDGIVQGLRRSEERYGGSEEFDLSVNVFTMRAGSGSEQAEVERAFQEDSELLFIGNQIAIPILEPAAAYFPEKSFVLIDMEATGLNIYSAMFKPNEAAYLCGALAAKMSETGLIGIVIGMDLPALDDFCVGYIAGALAADPGVRVFLSVVGNFYDADAGYALAAEQFERGADVVFSAAGGAGLGCIQAASDLGFYAIGVDVDQTEQVEPDIRDAILTSCLKNFDALVSVTLDSYLAGTLTFGESGRFGLKDGAVGIARNAYYLSNVPQSIRDGIDELEEQVRAGDIRVRSAFEMTRGEIDELYRSARP